MPITGTHKRTLDDSNRFAVPKKMREQFSNKKLSSLFITTETEKSLGLYSPEAFEQLAGRLANQSTNRIKQQNFLRMFYSRAEEVSIDSQGRVRIPDRLVDFSQLDGEIYLLGVHDHAEIWSSAAWENFMANNQENYDDLATIAFEPS